jgi:hypothetical protein
MSRLRQVSDMCGPGWVITIREEGTWILEDVPATPQLGMYDRYYTDRWLRRCRDDA